MQVDFALSSLDDELDVVGVEDALYFLQGPLSRIVPKSPAKVNSADFFTFNLMLIPASNVAFAVPAKSFFNGGNSIPPFGNEFVVILPLAANYLSLERDRKSVV